MYEMLTVSKGWNWLATYFPTVMEQLKHSFPTNQRQRKQYSFDPEIHA